MACFILNNLLEKIAVTVVGTLNNGENMGQAPKELDAMNSNKLLINVK